MGRWGKTEHFEKSHTVTSAEETATKAVVDYIISNFPQRIRLLSLSGHNATTQGEQFEMGFRPKKGLAQGGFDEGTYTILASGICVLTRTDIVWSGMMIVDVFSLWAEATNPTAADLLIFRGTFQRWIK